MSVRQVSLHDKSQDPAMLNALTQIRIGSRLAIAFAIPILLCIGLVAYGLKGLGSMDRDLDSISKDLLPKVESLNEISSSVYEIGLSMRNSLLKQDPESVRAEMADIEKNRLAIVSRLEKLDKTIQRPEARAKFADLLAKRAAYVPLQSRFVELVSAGNTAEALTLLTTQLDSKQNTYLAAIAATIDAQEAIVRGAAEAGSATYAATQAWKIGLTALVVLLVTLGAWAITRSITQPLAAAVAGTRRVAEGDLSQAIHAQGRDEPAELLRALATMQASLQRLVGEVRGGVESVATASGQIAQGNLDLSSRTEQQASSLQQTAASMEQMTATVKNSADRARTANQLAVGASEVAARGGQSVEQVVATMAGIQAASKRIADIIGTIDGIAFQTNILALNAAVEAARAGEQGRGFAVVAGEVRTLAQRSAEAAREIKQLISDSVEKVDAGNQLVGSAGATMREVVDQVKRVTDLIGEISAAAGEQTAGIGQVNTAVSELDRTTQQNAALVEESAAAALISPMRSVTRFT
jgi:methyl-accepting chemotaxis protein